MVMYGTGAKSAVSTSPQAIFFVHSQSVVHDKGEQQFESRCRMNAQRATMRSSWPAVPRSRTRADAATELFRTTIEFFILAKHPFKDFLRFKNLNGLPVMNHNMARYLKYRVRSRHGAQPFLPDYTISLRHWLLRENPEATTYKQMQYADKISQALACSTSVCYWFTKWSATANPGGIDISCFDDDVFVVNRVAGAAAVGDHKIIRDLLHERPHLLWQASHVLGYPLAAAAAGGRLDLVKSISKDFENNRHKTPSDGYMKGFQGAITAALINKNQEVVAFLLKVHHDYFPPIPRAMYEDRMKKAARAMDNFTVQTLTYMGSVKDAKIRRDRERLQAKKNRRTRNS